MKNFGMFLALILSLPVAAEEVICPEDKPLSYKGTCYACDYMENYKIRFSNEKECLKCSNRIWTGYKCRWNVSPDPKKPLVNDEMFLENSMFALFCSCPNNNRETTDCCQNYNFYSCEEKRVIYTTQSNCALCPNRFWEAGRCITKNILMHAPHLELEYLNEKEREKCKNEKKDDCDLRFFMILNDGNDREFYECNTPKAVFSSKSNCDLCPNREYKDHYCLLKETGK